jgi:hypothetical protein
MLVDDEFVKSEIAGDNMGTFPTLLDYQDCPPFSLMRFV